MAEPEGSPAAAPPTERIPPASWWMLAVLLLLYMLSLLDRGTFNMLVVPIQKDFGLSDTQMGLLLGPAFAISYSLFGLPLGWASDRFPRRWIIFMAVVVWSLAAAGTGLAWSFTSLLMARIMIGVGEAALSPSAYSLIADGFPQRRLTLAMSVYQTGSKLGAALSFSVVALAAAIAATMHGYEWPLVGQLQSWQIVFLLTGAPGIVIGLLLFTFREPERRPRAVDKPGEVAAFLPYLRANKRLIGLMLLAICMCSIAVLAMGAWVPALLERKYDLTPQQYGPILSLIGMVGAFTLVFKGLIVDWLHGRGLADAHLRFLSWLIAAAAPLSLFAFFSPGVLPFWIAYAVVDLIVGQFTFYFATTVQLVTPAELRGRTMALFQGAFSLVGMGLGPMLVAFVTDYVFADPLKIDLSLAIIAPGAFVICLLSLRAVLGDVRRAVAAPQSVEALRKTV